MIPYDHKLENKDKKITSKYLEEIEFLNKNCDSLMEIIVKKESVVSILTEGLSNLHKTSLVLESELRGELKEKDNLLRECRDYLLSIDENCIVPLGCKQLLTRLKAL